MRSFEKALESRAQLKESGIPLMSGIGRPSSTDKESGIQGVESRIQELLDFLTFDEKKEHEFNCCLPFTRSNRSVYCFCTWFAKFRAGKFRPGIAYTIGTNQFHLPKNGREGLKLISKMDLKEWDTNFRVEYSIRKNRTTFSDVPLLPEILRWEHPKSSCSIYSPTGFPGIFVNGKQPTSPTPFDG